METSGHGHGHSTMSVSNYTIPSIVADSSYFTHVEYSNVMILHIVLMTLAWLFVLPICMRLRRRLCQYMLRIPDSRCHAWFGEIEAVSASIGFSPGSERGWAVGRDGL